MGKKVNVSKTWGDGINKITVTLSLYVFQENGIFHVYSPHLNIVGNAYTEKGAWESFDIMLSDFLEYTIEKGTLKSELEKLGWVFKSNSKSIPPDSLLITKDVFLKQIVDEESYRVDRREIQIPAFA